MFRPAALALFDTAGVRFGPVTGTNFDPNLDSSRDLGTGGLRFRAGCSYTWDAKTEFRVDGTKVVGPRDTGWTAATGSASKAAWSADAVGALTFSSTPTQAECSALRDACAAAFKRQKALEDALRIHGLIN